VIYLYLGRRKLGKTTLALSMARKCPYRVMLDPRGLIHSGAPRVSDVDGVASAFDAMSNDDEHDETRRVREVLVTPEHDVQLVFDYTSREVKQWSKDWHDPEHRLMYVVDEARFFDLLDSPAFEYVMRAAPPELIHIAITAHRPVDIPTDVRAISDHWMLFRCTQEHDLKVIEERCGWAVRQEVSQLNPHEFVHWDDAIGTYRVYRDPAAWYVPLSVRSMPDPPDLLPIGGSKPVDTETLF